MEKSHVFMLNKELSLMVQPNSSLFEVERV